MSEPRSPLADLPPTFYRVRVKALIYDDEGRLLLVTNHHGHDELPGGGLEFGETIAACIRREIREELSSTLRCIGDITCVYIGRNHHSGVACCSLAIEVELGSTTIRPSDTIVSYRFVTKDEFRASNIERDEQGIMQHIDTILIQKGANCEKCSEAC